MLAPLLHADAVLRHWLAAPQAAWLDPIMIGLSAAGRGGAVWIALGLLLTLARRIRPASFWQLLLAVVLALAVSDVIVKPLVARPRPFTTFPAVVHVVGARPSDASFPSGHSTAAVAGAFMLAAFWPAARAWLWLLAALIMYSRIYLGVHYPLDVLGGALVGFAVAWLVIGGRDGRRLAGVPPPAGSCYDRQPVR